MPVSALREATRAERHLFFRWLVSGDPVAMHLLSEGTDIQIDTTQKKLATITAPLHYVINPSLLRTKVNEMDRERKKAGKT